MGITRSQLESWANTHGRYASWAIWNPDNPADAQIIFDHCEDLKTSVVMVGLNASRAVQPWAHFRGGKHDRKLIKAFNLSSYRGAYMTDIIKGEITPDSGNIIDGIRTGEIDLQKHITGFCREMADIGVPSNALFILFGQAVEKVFCGKDWAKPFTKGLAHTFPNYVRCVHYSARGTDNEWVTGTQAILEQHYIRTYPTFNTLPFSLTGQFKAGSSSQKAHIKVIKQSDV